MIAQLLAWARGALSAWENFWFDSKSDDVLTTLAAFRIAFCGVMFVCYFARAFDVDFFYTGNGIMPLWHKESIDYFRYHPTIFSNEMNPYWIHGAHTLLLGFILAQAFGFATRVSSIGAYFLHLMFANRNMPVMFGVDMIGTFFFFYLCFANSNARWSIDKLLGWQAKTQSGLSHIAWRLMQLQVCIIYGYSGLEKMKGTRWWDGSALWDVLTIGNMQRFDLSFVAHVPFLLAAAVYIVLLWEIYFPALVWQKKTRLPILAFGVFMHIGIYVFMNLPSFGFMMMSLYLLFLRREEVEAGVRGISWKALRSRARA
jgi:hypothetical protein